MTSPIVICDYGFVKASLVPARLLAAPGNCPYGVYDTILWDDGHLVRFDDHLKRFETDCRYVGVKEARWEERFSRTVLCELMRINHLDGARGRLRLMAFLEPQDIDSELLSRISFLAAVWAAPEPSTTAAISCMVSSFQRKSNDQSYQHKLLGRHEVTADLETAAAAGCQDVIYFNDRDEVCEGAYSNLWLIKDSVVYTPPVASPCLPGTVRKLILEQGKHIGLEVRCDKPIPRDLLAQSNAVFLTSSIRGIQRVRSIKGLWQGTENTATASEIIPRLVTSLSL